VLRRKAMGGSSPLVSFSRLALELEVVTVVGMPWADQAYIYNLACRKAGVQLPAAGHKGHQTLRLTLTPGSADVPAFHPLPFTGILRASQLAPIKAPGTTELITKTT